MPAMKTTQQMRDELLLKGLSGGGEVKAPVTPTGFYSPLEEAALRIQRKAGNAQAFMNDLKTVPKEHLQHAGVDKLLTSRPTITREELQQHVAQAAPKVEVKVLGSREPWRDRLDLLATRGYRNLNPEERQEYEALSDRFDQEGPSRQPEDQQTKFNQYTLPGGQNYREVLLTLPTGGPSTLKAMSDAELRALILRNDNNADVGGVSRQHLLQMVSGMNLSHQNLTALTGKNTAQYKSSHWDEPNVLAHFRINDRTDKDGKKVLFVEEIQSDWGQEGKKEGFADPNKKPVSQKEFNTYVDRLLDDYVARQVRAGVNRDEATNRGIHMQLPEMAQALGRADEYARMRAGRDMDMSGTTGVPTAPFVTKTNDWVNLALKHILKMAAEEGHDRVAFVKGEQAADRFGLDKHFSRIHALPVPGGGYELHTTDLDGYRESSVNVPKEKLKEYVGEEFAKKIQAQGGGVFEGNDLHVPNTGIRKFYNELVPAQAHALVKKFGGQGVKPIPLSTPPKIDPYTDAAIEPDNDKFAITVDGYVVERYPSEAEAKEAIRSFDTQFWRGELENGGYRRINRPPEEYQGFDITPQMRQQILKPMSYKVGGAVPAMDAMRLQVWDKRRGR